MRVPGKGHILSHWAARELVLLLGLSAAGFLILPAVVWLIGMGAFGPQAGGLGGVYGSVFSEAARGKPAAWLFAASPWLVVQSARVVLLAFRGGADRADTSET